MQKVFSSDETKIECFALHTFYCGKPTLDSHLNTSSQLQSREVADEWNFILMWDNKGHNFYSILPLYTHFVLVNQIKFNEICKCNVAKSGKVHGG